MANSTFQVAGSVALSVFTTTGNLTLDEDYQTIVIGGNHNITLPAANTCEGRIYVVKNSTTNTPTISAYLDVTGASQTAIPAENVLWLQSDGTNWLGHSYTVTENIYNTDGTLTGNRTMTMGTNLLNFESDEDSKATLTVKRTDNNNEIGIAFRNSGDAYDAAIVLEQGSGSLGTTGAGGLDFYAGNNSTSLGDLQKTLSLHNDNQIEFSEYGAGTPLFLDNAPEYFLGVNNTGEVVEVTPTLVVHKGTEGSVFFADATDGSPTEDNDQFFWDDTNDRLGIGTAAPAGPLHIEGNIGTGLVILEGTEPDIIINDDDGAGFTTINFQRNGVDNTLLGLNDDDNFYIGAFDGGFFNNAFTLNNGTRNVGINVAEANSRLQVDGAISKSILRTVAALTLTNSHYSIIISDASHNVVLPAADATNEGREYVIKNPNSAAVTISSYLDHTDSAVTSIPANNVLKVQSDGTSWNQMNNYTNTPEVIDKVANYTLVAADDGNIITFPGDADYTLTIPSGLTKNFNISVYQKDDGTPNNGNITIVNGAGATIINRLDRFITAGDGAGVGIVALEDDVFYITGDLKLM